MVDAKKWLQREIGEEFSEARLGDARRTGRLQVIARAAESSPGVGFPQMVESDGELEGIYRFLGNQDVSADAILAPHIRSTLDRARQAPLCLMVHDTTAFEFNGAGREGLGLTNGKRPGFYAHFALAVLPGKERIPLGVCGLERISRQVRKKTLRPRHSHYVAKDPDRESLRWSRLVQSVEQQREGFECIHVMDREADMFDLMALMIGMEARFIIRGDKERALANEPGLVEDLLNRIKPTTYRRAELNYRVDPRRKLIKLKRSPIRQARSAELAIGSATVELRRPKVAHAAERSLKIHVIYVWEPSPPKGQDPVDWVLFTTESIDTPEQLHAVVDHYQSRWVIEEYFKALKTGCAFERRQLESFHALSNALAVLSVVAWRMLLARAVCRAHPSAKASTVLSPTQLRVLQRRLNLPKLPATAREALFAVARIGGHLKRNGDPGWLTLGRGFEKLLLLEAGWRAALGQFPAGDPINP
jgi:hypothetical protein